MKTSSAIIVMSILSLTAKQATCATYCEGPIICETGDILENTVSHCSSYGNSVCYRQNSQTTYIKTCNTCNSGYTKTQKTVTLSRGVCNGTSVNYYTCESSGGGEEGGEEGGDETGSGCIALLGTCGVVSFKYSFTGSNCATTSNTVYYGDNTSAIQRCGKVTSCLTCNSGYKKQTTYVNPDPTNTDCSVSFTTCIPNQECEKGYYLLNGSCERCPSSGGVYGTTAGTGATNITECYIPAGTTLSDTTGEFTFSTDCYYTK